VTRPQPRVSDGMFAARTNWNLKTNRLSEALARHRAARNPLLDLTASNPTTCGFHYNAPEVLSALADPASLLYEPQSKGLESARKAVVAYYAERDDQVEPEDIILTTSTSEAYSFVFRALCEPGDEILIPAPSYPLFDFLADIQDVKPVRYPLLYDYGWQIDFPALERAITPRTRAVILVHPNNPTGHFCSAREIARFNEICSHRQMAVIADEVFLDFALAADRQPSFATNTTSLTFTMSGLSKISGLPQMKFAWLVATGPRELKAQALARLEVIADTYLSMNAPVQHAACALLGQRHGFQRQLMERVRKNLAELDLQLSRQKACSRLEVQGGWYAVLRVPATRPDEDLAIALLEAKNVYIHPGHFYDFPGDGHLVVSLITAENDFAEGIQRLTSIF
jgi:alanine-synthesizing transaminase